mmetsp:Transcript_28710/g.31879  ORF Transcript_28710/g.31879 Transcript_28710/m.31879 type:complete len:219 (+) Transcript_28710:69-725(+)
MTSTISLTANERTCMLLNLPVEVLLILGDIDAEIFVLWPLLCARTAVTSRYDADFNKHGRFKKWHFTNCRPRKLKFAWNAKGSKVLSNHFKLKRHYLKENVRFEHGKKDGEYKLWHVNGRLMVHGFWKNDVREGDFKTWYSDGKIHRHYHFKGGRKHGECKTWTEDGAIEIFKWKNGVKQVAFGNDGNLMFTSEEASRTFIHTITSQHQRGYYSPWKP